jgi:HAD superfamily hydrolase (TIGR01509 family)
MAVATSSDAVAAAFTLRAGGLDGRFETIVTGDQIARGKPEPDIYLEAARRLAVDPRHCIALEDSDAGVLAARRAGMRTFMVPDLRPPSLEAASAAFRVFQSLDDVRSAILELIS